MKIVVGCPIRERAWIFPEWLECVRAAFDVVGLEPIWAFHVGLNKGFEDDGTYQMVRDLVENEGGLFSAIEEEASIPTGRVPWSLEHYENIVGYRNKLLGLVRQLDPDYFLSCDSDILLHPAALCLLLDSISVCGRAFDAVAGKVYLGAHKNIVSYAMHATNGGLRRQDQDGVFEVEIIMALKLMNHRAYKIDYAFNRFGEDIGWSDNCRAAGLKLGFDGRLASKHIMRQEKLHEIDKRVGW